MYHMIILPSKLSADFSLAPLIELMRKDGHLELPDDPTNTTGVDPDQ